MKICTHCECQERCRVPTEGIEGFCLARSQLSSNVRELRHEAGLTQKQLARRAGIDRSYLARIETEAINISINVLFALSKALSVDPERLLHDRKSD